MKGILLGFALAYGSAFGQQIMIGNTTDSVFVKQVKETAKSNGYRSIRDDIFEAETYLSDRVLYEMHIGTGAMNHELFNKMGFIAMKINIGQRKVTNLRSIQPLIERAKLIQAEYEFSSDKEISKKINDLESKLNTYQNSPWYSKFGVGVLIPLIIEERATEETQSYSVQRDVVTGELDTSDSERTYSSSRKTYNSASDFNEVFSKTSFLIMYDIKEYFTISSGVNFEREFVLGISIDISTPITRAGHSFFQMFGDKANTSVPFNSTPRSQYGN
jgi:hypothetical protein